MVAEKKTLLRPQQPSFIIIQNTKYKMSIFYVKYTISNYCNLLKKTNALTKAYDNKVCVNAHLAKIIFKKNILNTHLKLLHFTKTNALTKTW